jgi:energy-coupling factor transport system permease protein
MQLTYQYRHGDSAMHRLDPVSKFVWLFAVSFVAFGAFYLWMQLVLLAIVVFFAKVLSHLSLRGLWRATWWFAAACTSYVLVQTILLRATGETLLFTLPLVGKPIYLEVVSYSTAVGLRIYLVFLVAVIFIRTTHPRDLAVGFVQILRLPYKIPYALFIALRTIPVVEAEARNIMAAHRVRGVGERAGLRNRVENAKRLTIPLMIRALRDGMTTTESMECRAFGAHRHRTYVDEIRMGLAGKALTFGSIAFVITWYTLIFSGVIDFRYSVV